VSELDVVYISGAPRSGTTVLGIALGQLQDTCDVGELWALWRPAYRSGDLCGCGLPVRDCEFWRAVVERALGPNFEARGASMGALHKRVLGTLSAPRVWLHVSGRRRRTEYDDYADLLGHHYRAIAEVSGARVIVDSSKMASDALLASTIPGVRLTVIHLVRDPRAVAWSWHRQRRQPGPDGRAIAPQGALASAARWDAYNTFAELLLAPRVSGRFRCVRYEDLLADPTSQIPELARFIGRDPATVRIGGDPPHLAMTRPAHPVWGNPVRTSTGDIALRTDTEWHTEVPAGMGVGATLATLPLLVRYGYPVGWKAATGRRR
jgi:hypothetical protein